MKKVKCSLEIWLSKCVKEVTGSEPLTRGDYFYDMELIIDASKGETKKDGTYINDVYGKSDHLQTNNITVKYWKRIA